MFLKVETRNYRLRLPVAGKFTNRNVLILQATGSHSGTICLPLVSMADKKYVAFSPVARGANCHQGA